MPRTIVLPRLLPTTICATALLLAFKCGSVGLAAIYDPIPGWAVTLSPFTVAPAEAAPADKPPADKPSAGKPPAGKPPAEAPPEAEAISSKPEPEVSAAERKLLLDLRSRRLELDAREHALADRDATIAAAARTLDDRIGQLAALQTRLEKMEAARKDHDEANWAGIVKLYETMKPRDAATIFNEMEMPVLLQVVDRMKDTKAAAIMAAMQPDRARLLTAQLAAARTRATTVPDHAVSG